MNEILSRADAFELHEILFQLPKRPPRITRSEVKGLGAEAAERHHAARCRYITSDFIVATPALQDSLTAVERIQRRDRHRSFGRSAVLLDGPGGAGKTTTCLAIAAAEARRAGRDGPPRVVYVEVPSRATPKSLLEAFLTKIRIDPPKRATIGQLMQLVVGNFHDLGIELVIIDELQHLAFKTQTVVEAVNTLKSLRNAIASTFVYAGVNIAVSALMAGSHGQQLARRTVRQTILPMDIGTPDGAGQWRGIIRAFEVEMGLMDHTIGSLMAESRALFDRTGGSIGALRHLLVDAALDAIDANADAIRRGDASGAPERIDIADLLVAKVDMGAELLAGASAA